MNIHFICRGNILRSLIAETYVRSLHVPNIEASSSGTNVDMQSLEERAFFAKTLLLLKRYGIDEYAKSVSDQLTQARIDGQDIIICMNQRVLDEAKSLVELPETTICWSVIDIGEGHRTVVEDTRRYEDEIFQEIVAKVDELISQYNG